MKAQTKISVVHYFFVLLFALSLLGFSGVGGVSSAQGACLGLTSDFTPPMCAATGPGLSGPWNMRLMTATSSDGLTFTRTNQIVTDQGDVPDLARDSQGCIYLYYTGWTVGSELNKTVVAVSADGGATWVYKKLNLSGFEGMASPVDPDIQILPDGTFRLYLTSDPPDGQGPRTYYAEGTDGINFTKVGVAFAVSGKAVLDPSTLLVGSTWHIFAGGQTTTPGANWHGTSSDGTSFTLVGEKVFTIGGVNQLMANGIAFPAEIYRFYTFDSGTEPTINSLFTTDGVTWTPDAGHRLVLDASTGKESQLVKDPTVVQLSSGTYLMVYGTVIPEECLSDLPDLTGEFTRLTRRSFGSRNLLGFTLAVQNNGTAATEGAFGVDFYLSADETFDEDVFLTSLSVSDLLEPGEEVELSGRLRISGSISGQFVLAVVDVNEEVVETDEVNNVVAEEVP